MKTHMITAAVAAVLAFGAAWYIQDLRSIENENHRIAQQIEAEREISRMESKRSAEVIAAQNAARLREGKLRMDAAAAKSAVAGLRRALDAAVQAARADFATCVDTAATEAELLAQCSQRYSELAATADRHVSDIKTLTEAWPK